jgi:hypothetical protein
MLPARPDGSMARRSLSVRALAGLLAGISCLLALPVGAGASGSQESMFQDDTLLVYARPSTVARTLDTLRALGIDRVRVSVFWSLVAPAPKSTDRPRFDAADPDAYPRGAWDRYDVVIRLARERGIDVDFNVTSPAPFWATGRPRRHDIWKNYNPSPRQFQLFVRAVGRRYAGNWVPGRGAVGAAPASAATAGSRTVSPLDALAPASALTAGSAESSTLDAGTPAAVPRVDYWSIWNEPNQPGWLTPQWVLGAGHRYVEASPAIYRSLLDAAVAGLALSGHTQGRDTILIGETAPKGLNVQGQTRAIKPMPFLRRLYCLDDHYRFLHGTAAREQRCPTTVSQISAFPRQHPGLFFATGWAHHPYELSFAPHQVSRDRDFVTVANLRKLERALDLLMHRYGVRRAPMPLYLTEYGYLTDPPTPLGVSLAQQAAYLDESEFITSFDPRVRALSQFLLRDDRPKPGIRDRVRAYGGTFQTGLEFVDGRHKPSFAAYRLPIFLPNATFSRGAPVLVWGMLRPAPNGTRQRARVQFRSTGAFRTVDTVTALPARGYLRANVRLPGSGAVRIAWTDPASGLTIFSRAVAVRAR